MAAFAYYKAERERHAAAQATPISLENAQALINFLSDELVHASLKVGRHSMMTAQPVTRVNMIINTRSKGTSLYHRQYKDGKPLIRMAPMSMNLRVTIHEWAHHAAWKLYGVWRAVYASPYYNRLSISNYRAHDLHHAELVDWGIEQGRKWLNSRIESFVAEMLETLATKQPAMRAAAESQPKEIVIISLPNLNDNDLRQTFFNSLQAELVCPCCKMSKPKAEIGVRLMNGKNRPEGVAPKFARQSKCHSCRKIQGA